MGNKQGHICIVLFLFLDQGFHFLLTSSREMEFMGHSFFCCGRKILVELEMILFSLHRHIIKILYVATFPIKSLGFTS